MDPYGKIDRESFLQMPTPRRVPASIRRAATPGGFKGFGILFGGFFLLMGLAFSWFFIPKNLLAQWQLEKETAQVTGGTITEVVPTNMSIGEKRVFRGRFTFRLQGEKPREGEAFITGNGWEVGQPVRVRYLPDDPSRAVPEGGRLDGFTGATMFVLIFPLVGAGIMLGGIFAGSIKRRILTHGLLSSGKVKSMQPTSVRINHKPQYKFVVVREDDLREFTVRRHLPDEVAFLQGKMAGEERLKILYDPNKPQRMLFPETWNA